MAESAAEQLGDDKAKLHAPWGDSENQSDERPEPKKLIINDFDSAYVKLAKSGGHKGLLEYNAAKGSVEAKSYTRPGWFDHEHPCSPAENRDVSATSHLPDYMVYDAPTVPQVNLTPKSEARPPPFSLQDDMSVFKREGKAATDKSVRISGDRRPTRRHADKIWNPEPAKPVKPLQASLTSVHDKIPKKHMPPAPYEVEPVNMAKLLAGDYQKEWQDHHEKWIGKQLDRSAVKDLIAANRKITPCKRLEEREQKPLFKLKQFEKVGSRVQSIRSPNVTKTDASSSAID